MKSYSTRDICESKLGADDDAWEDRRWVPLEDVEATVKKIREALVTAFFPKGGRPLR